MIFVFYILAALLVWFSYKSLRSGIAYLKYFKQGLAKPASEYAPFVSVIAPCRGVDQGLEENLMALLEQDYPAFEVIFVVDDESDQAISVIKRLSCTWRLNEDQTRSDFRCRATGADVRGSLADVFCRRTCQGTTTVTRGQG